MEAVASGPATICLGSLSLWMLRVMHRGDSNFSPVSALCSIFANLFVVGRC